MKPFVWILLGCLALAPPGLALKPAAANPEADSRRSELTTELGAFVKQAVDDGLLDPVGKAEPKEVPDTAESAPRAAPPAAAPVTSGAIDCSAPYPLDFAEFENLTQYRDIYRFREDAPQTDETGEESLAFHPGARLAKAYIALDLASEASMTLKTARDQQAVAVYNLSLLLESRGPVPVTYFTDLAACYPRANLWRALALIAQQDASGAALIEEELSSFRQLPIHLRDRAALIAIPELDALGQQTLAKMLIASFSEEEISNSAQLQFSRAIVELAAGNPEAEKLIGNLLIQSRFQEPALAALIRHKRPVNDTVRAFLVDDMINRIEVAQLDSDVRDDLRFVLDEMSASSMYVPMLKLAELPNMQTPAAREELNSHFAASLRRDLESEDSLRNLAAIEALIKDPGLLDAVPDRPALYGTATEVAVRLGFGALGDALSAKAQSGEGVAEQRAVLAYRQKKFDEVYALAASFPKNQKINRIAALAAIDANDKLKLGGIERRLSLDSETILALIEQDAAKGHWIVSEGVFEAAAKLTSDDEKARVARVASLKAQPPERVSTGRVAMTSIPDKLSQTRASLQQLSGQDMTGEQTSGETP